MMKGTPCSRRCRASLKTLGKTRYIARSSNPAKSGFVLGREAAVQTDPFPGLGRPATGARHAPILTPEEAGGD